jgi:uncharacterized protein (DUF433 family)
MTDATLANPLLSQNLSSIPAEIDVSACANLAEMLEAALAQYVDRVAFHCSGRAVTYQNRARTNEADSHSTSVWLFMPNQTANLLNRITFSPQQCGGRPCIRGMRVRVSDVLDLLAAGASRDEIIADYPYLESDDITAVLQYAARQSDHLVLLAA